MSKPSSARRIVSSRANGALSRGPITAEGKARSAQNALSHGLTANSVVLSNECPDQFRALADRYLNFFQPQDPIEEDMVEDLTVARWRIHRIETLESAVVDMQQDLQQEEIDRKFEHIDPPFRLAAAVQASHDQSKVLPQLSRYESRNRRIYNQSLDRLGYEPTKKQKTQNEPSPKNEQ